MTVRGFKAKTVLAGVDDLSIPAALLEAPKSPAEEFAEWVASLEWASAREDGITMLLREVQKRARDVVG